MSASIDALVNKEYQYGFVTDVDAEAAHEAFLRSLGCR